MGSGCRLRRGSRLPRAWVAQEHPPETAIAAGVVPVLATGEIVQLLYLHVHAQLFESAAGPLAYLARETDTGG